MVNVRGTVALVTGASSGIGRAVALRLAAEGAEVLVHGRDGARTEEVARLAAGTPLVADLAVPGSHGELADRALAVHGRIDILVAGAGAGWSGRFADMDDGELRRLVELDLVAPLALTRAVLPGMTARRVFGSCDMYDSPARTIVLARAWPRAVCSAG